MAVAEQLQADDGRRRLPLHTASRAGANLLFEGAQGTLLDIDHGTYPYVTSSNCVAGNAAAGAGVGPDMLHYILGITKAYTTRVGCGPVPDRAADGRARHASATTCRPSARSAAPSPAGARRCGWLDAAALKRSIIINGISGLCITKLDVLDGLAEIKVCVGYELRRQAHRHPAARRRRHRRPACRSTRRFPGWTETHRRPDASGTSCRSTRGATWSACRRCIGAPIDMVSTGPDRDHTILLRHPYQT